ncbi:phage head-tail joining protein [Methylobacterium brachythecii]|uniref:Uncharacterized protein n=1 Tax=Methylobacterium brachythecii TaxID=1176177 RepID=A0A7W6AIX5_9HYPH|nr:hypothetical protein [Methylobacterium brachythecii]MBB3904195.1 hypothetical protein [Methylobacterium brachythecii]GLS45143.1 hypothetical protein GCM10007884_31320 [Methylobacterium brachythecii]
MAGYTQKQVDSLKQAIGSGALTVDYPERGRITYRSLAEMRQILIDMERDIAGAAGGGRTRTRRIVMTTSGGL